MAQEQKDTEQQGPVGFNGHRNFTMDELAALQPGLAIFMPMIGDRWWNVYYAAKEANWVMAKFELGEGITLMQKGMQTRPRYTDALKAYIDDDLAPVEAAEDSPLRLQQGHGYHDEFRKGYLRPLDFNEGNVSAIGRATRNARLLAEAVPASGYPPRISSKRHSSSGRDNPRNCRPSPAPCSARADTAGRCVA